MPTRLIARLDVKPPFVVKPVYFEGLRKVGDPVEMAKQYYDQGADEIFYIDIVASLYRREILFDQIEKVASQLFVPFAVGGGIKTIDDISRLLHSGADKVILNTHVLQEDASLIDRAAEKFGSQAVTVHIQAKKTGNDWVCVSDCARIPSRKKVLNWAQEVAQRGAGEILLSSVDYDGARKGFDQRLIEQVVPEINIPMVIGSGAGSLSDVASLVQHIKPSGVAIASFLHKKLGTIQQMRQKIFS